MYTVTVHDLFHLFLLWTRISNSLTYQIFIILATKSQTLRNLGPASTMTKKAMKGYVLIRLIIESFFLATSLPEFFLTFNKPRRHHYPYKRLFIYPDNDGWVLTGIAKDFVEHMPNAESLSFRHFVDIYHEYQGLSGCTFFYLHHDLYVRFSDRYPSSRPQSIVYVPHLRTVTNQLLHKLILSKRVYCQSTNDQIRLIGLGLSFGHADSLPVGFDPKNFPSSSLALGNKRPYDICFSLPYRYMKRGSHYYKRKNVDFLQNLILKLSVSHTILILGEEWDNSIFSCSDNVHIVNPSYADKHKWLLQSRLFASLSLIEGGPVSLLEAISSGCYVVGFNTGLLDQLVHDFPERVFSVPVSTKPDMVISSVISILALLPPTHLECSKDYQKLCRDYSFKSLAQGLERYF